MIELTADLSSDPRAFMRSAGFTIVVTALAMFFFFPFIIAQSGIALTEQMFGKNVAEAMRTRLEWQVFIAFVTNILADYVGLFAVRFVLVKGQRFPILASFQDRSLERYCFVVFIVRDFMLFFLLRNHSSFGIAAKLSAVRAVSHMFLLSESVSDWWTFFFGAMVVYFWLPLLAGSLGVVKLLNYFQ